MPLLGRRDLEEVSVYKLWFPISALRPAMGMVREKPHSSTAVTSKERITETVQWQRESSYEEKSCPTRMRQDLSLFPQQKLFRI